MSHEIDAVLRRNIIGVLSDIDPIELHSDQSLDDLGANSLDRVDILTLTFDELGLKLAPQDLKDAQTLGAISDLLRKHSGQ